MHSLNVSLKFQKSHHKSWLCFWIWIRVFQESMKGSPAVSDVFFLILSAHLHNFSNIFALTNITSLIFVFGGLGTNFEKGLWRPWLEELQKHRGWIWSMERFNKNWVSYCMQILILKTLQNQWKCEIFYWKSLIKWAQNCSFSIVKQQ